MSQTVFGPQGGLQMKTAIAGAAITYGQVLKRGADQNTVIPNTAATIVPIGIAADDQSVAGRSIPIHNAPGETCRARAGAAIALDALLTSDANGRVVTAASTNKIIGICREAATGADQLITIELVAQGQVAP